MALIEQINSKDYKELHARYGGTYGFLPKADGTKLAVKIHEIGPKWVSVFDHEANEYRINCDTGGVLEFTQVLSGWYELYPGKAVFLARKPERQWKRGISHDNTSMLAFGKDGELYNHDWDGFTIQQIFYKDNNIEYPKSDLDVKVLNKFFAIGQGKIYIKNLKCGDYFSKDRIAAVIIPEIKQELHDAFVRNNMEVNIV